MVGARAELPAPIEDVAAVDRLGHSLWRIWGGHPGVYVIAPHLGGHLWIGIGQLIGVPAHPTDDPAGRRIERRRRHYRLGELARVDLEPLVTLRLQQPDQPGRLHALYGVCGEPAAVLCFRGLVT